MGMEWAYLEKYSRRYLKNIRRKTYDLENHLGMRKEIELLTELDSKLSPTPMVGVRGTCFIPVVDSVCNLLVFYRRCMSVSASHDRCKPIPDKLTRSVQKTFVVLCLREVHPNLRFSRTVFLTVNLKTIL